MKSRLLLMYLATCLAVLLANQNHAVESGSWQLDPGGSSVRDQFIGTWKLVSTELKYSDGKIQPYRYLGPRGIGYLIYDKSGHMCVQLMNPERPKWKDVDKPTEQEKAAAMDGFRAYCGTYEIHEREHVILHHSEVAWNPNLVGTIQRRPYTLDGDRLTFSGKSTEANVETWAIVWQRVK